jgi:hypothetical protein
MNSPIVQLEQVVWESCVHRRAAPDMETVTRWQNDPLEYQQNGFWIAPLRSDMKPLVDQATAQWKQTEKEVLSRLGMSRDEFLTRFERARDSFQSGGNEWQDFSRYGSFLQGTVMNLDVVNLFAWTLPAADPDNREEHRAIGRMVTAVFYTECLYKSRYQDDSGEYQIPSLESIILKLEARWRLLSQAASTLR